VLDVVGSAVHTWRLVPKVLHHFVFVLPVVGVSFLT